MRGAVEDRLASLDQNGGQVGLAYHYDPRVSRWRWTAYINIKPVRRGTPARARLREAYGVTPLAAMLSLESALRAEGIEVAP